MAAVIRSSAFAPTRGSVSRRRGAADRVLLPRQGPRTRPRAARIGVRDVEDDLHINFYQLLGVPPTATKSEVREAYKMLAKLSHPDVAGSSMADAFALINRAYTVLSDPSARLLYDSGRSLFGNNSKFGEFTGEPLSKNAKPSKAHAVFVDENTCIGCRACVHEAPKTFEMDETYGKARVAVQWADDEDSIDVAFEMCPVSCIHRVHKHELAVLEFVQRSMPPRSHLVHSDSSNSGAARGMEESPFVAAERFESKKAKLLAEAQARKTAEQRLRSTMDAIERNCGWFPWRTSGKQADRHDSLPTVGPSCPLIHRNNKFASGPMCLPASSSSRGP